MSEDFVATITGAAIAGGVGLFAVFVQRALEARNRLNVEILEPAFDYVDAVPSVWPWSGVPEAPWLAAGRHELLRIPTKMRREMDGFVRLYQTHQDTYARYFEFMSSRGWGAFNDAVRRAMSGSVSPDGSGFPARSIGIDSDATVQIPSLAVGLAPYVLLYRDSADQAWAAIAASTDSMVYWAREAAAKLRKENPETLDRLRSSILASPDAEAARERVVDMFATFEKLSAQARVVKRLVGKRLGLPVGKQDRPK